MAWEDDKSTAADPDNPANDEQLTADEWDAHVGEGHWLPDNAQLGQNQDGDPVVTDPQNGDAVILRYDRSVGEWVLPGLGVEGDIVDRLGSRVVYDESSGTVGDGSTSADHALVSTKSIPSGQERFASDFDGTDGGQQIQAAIDDLPASGGRVVVRGDGPDTNGRWDISSTIVPPSNVHIDFSGYPTLRLADGTNDDLIHTDTDSSGDPIENVVVEGPVELDGNKANNSLSSAAGTGNCGVRVVNTKNCRVSGVFGHDFYSGYAIEVKYSEDVTVENCRAEQNGDDGFSVSDLGSGQAITQNVRLRNCTAYNNSNSGFEVDDGPEDVRITDCWSGEQRVGYTVHSHGGEKHPENIHIENCVAKYNDARDFGLYNLAGDGTPREYHIRGCTAISNPAAANIDIYNNDGDALDTIRISDVTVRNGGSGKCVRIDSNSVPINDLAITDFDMKNLGGDSAIMHTDGSGVNGLVIEDGKIEKTGTRDAIRLWGGYETVAVRDVVIMLDSDADQGVQLYATSGAISDATVTGVTVSNGDESGIVLHENGHAFTNAVVSDCTAFNNGQNGSGAENIAGISINSYGGSPLTDIRVLGNRCYDDQGTQTQAYGVYHDGADYNLYDGNILRGNGTGSFSGTAGTNSVKGDNIT